MKLKLAFVLLTEIKYGGSGSICMFSRKTELTLTEDIIQRWLVMREYQITFDSLSFIIKELEYKNGEPHGNTHQYLPPDTSLKRYLELTQGGWIPNTHMAHKIRDHGHTNFFPE